jgi:hypothetical protein
VHLCVGDRRTVGRGPLQGAATAAAVATLDALTELDEPHDCRVAWARIVETLPDGLVLVGVSLSRTGGGTVYGLAPGASPIEAAARATLDACARAIDHA